MTRVLLALLIVTLGGCYRWEKVGEPTKHIRWQVTELATIQAIPGCETSIACAINFASQGFCVVLATTKEADTPAYIVAHENKHCAGYAHQ